MKYPVNIETCWIVGLWSADRGTKAKGVVAIVNTTEELLENFRIFSLRNFDITKSKFRERTIRGYGESKEVYFTRLPARRFIEGLLLEREKLSKKNILAYLAGRFDGDGNVDGASSSMCYYYSHTENQDAEIDKKLIEKLGFFASIEKGKNIVRLRILQPRFFASKLLPYLKHKKKIKNSLILMSKRPYRSERTRPTPIVATVFYGKQALYWDCTR